MSIFDTIVSREPIDRGWSADRKYKALTAGGQAYFLRISPAQRYAQRKLQFRHMCLIRDLGVRVCVPVEFGRCSEGCYTLLEWVDGRDAEQVIPQLTEPEQYALGLDAGEMLRRIHSLPSPLETPDWSVQFGQKLDRKIAAYLESPLKYEKGTLFLELLDRERHLTADRPTVWHHGDFHCGNLMLDNHSALTVIDFDREDVGDPWYEFNRIIWDVRAGAAFARGLVDGYFSRQVPEYFWRVLRLYLCQNMISSLPWAADFGEQEVRTARENAARILDWYDDLTRILPRWYA